MRPTLIVTALLLAACDNLNAVEKKITPVKTPIPMKSFELKKAEATDGPLSIVVSGTVTSNDGLTDLRLVVRLHNNGAAKLALMNGGTTRKPERGVFYIEPDADGVVTLSQKALPLPDPAPTVPIIAAATVLAPSASTETTWQATLETVTLNRPYMGFPGVGAIVAMPRPIKKIRVCVAYKTFDEKSFEAIKGHAGFFMPIGAIDREQRLVCSPVISLSN